MPRQKEPFGRETIELALSAVDGYLRVIARVEGLETEKSITPPLAIGVNLGEEAMTDRDRLRGLPQYLVGPGPARSRPTQHQVTLAQLLQHRRDLRRQ